VRPPGELDSFPEGPHFPPAAERRTSIWELSMTTSSSEPRTFRTDALPTPAVEAVIARRIGLSCSN
jgi:hypothetical protein